MNDRSIFPFLLLALFIVLPFTLNASLVVVASGWPVSSVIVAFTVVFLFWVLILSGVMSAAFFSSVSVPFGSLKNKDNELK